MHGQYTQPHGTLSNGIKARIFIPVQCLMPHNGMAELQ